MDDSEKSATLGASLFFFLFLMLGRGRSCPPLRHVFSTCGHILPFLPLSFLFPFFSSLQQGTGIYSGLLFAFFFLWLRLWLWLSLLLWFLSHLFFFVFLSYFVLIWNMSVLSLSDNISFSFLFVFVLTTGLLGRRPWLPNIYLIGDTPSLLPPIPT